MWQIVFLEVVVQSGSGGAEIGYPGVATDTGT